MVAMVFTDPNMFYASLLADDLPQIPQSPCCDQSPDDSSIQSPFEVSDYIAFEEGMHGGSSFMVARESEKLVFPADGIGESCENSPGNSVMTCASGSKRMKLNTGCRIGFRTKSKEEILDDGYKWRKYGKKSVKNSPNPRNYYRCSNEGCCVKKRVERDREDSSYVITTYEGIHNHTSPGAVCYISRAHPSAWTPCSPKPLLSPDAWTLQAARCSFPE